MTICILQNKTLPKNEEAMQCVRESAQRLGIRVLTPPQAAKADVLLVLGGDGSMLHAVRAYGRVERPFLGINIGSLGYLTASSLELLDETLRALRDGECTLEERSLLRAQVRRKGIGRAMEADLALNDLVVMRSETGRVTGFDLLIDGEPVTSFLCDGLILATPTGSTAYSLSAGGPILLPSVRGYIVNVICPHSLATRPLVIPEEAVATIRVSNRANAPISYSVDGQVRTMLHPTDTLTATTAAKRISLVTLNGHNPFDAMRSKLGWCGENPAFPSNPV